MVKHAHNIYCDPSTLVVGTSNMLQDLLEQLDTAINVNAVAISNIDPEAAAFYVDPVSGNDATGTGSEVDPVETIGQAIILATGAGGAGRIVVAAGTYAEAFTMVAGWSLEGRDRDTVIIVGDGGATPVITWDGVGNAKISKIQLNPVAGHTSGIFINNAGAGNYFIEQCGLLVPGANATVLIEHQDGTTVLRECLLNSIVGLGVAINLTGGTLGAETVLITCDNAHSVAVDTGAINFRETTIIQANTGTTEACISLTTGGDAILTDVLLNNTNPQAAQNGYGILSDLSATDIVLNNVRIQNNGTYVSAGAAAEVITTSAGGGETLTFNGLACPPADFGAAGIGNFNAVENGTIPMIYPDVFDPIAVNMVATGEPWDDGAAGNEAVPDVTEAILRLAHGLSVLWQTVITRGTDAGGGLTLQAYAAGLIPRLP